MIDSDAAGHGWFIDPTPGNDSEFAKGMQNSPASGRVDLLTVVTHEIGHTLGFDDHVGNDVMGETLALGTRRLPSQPAVAGVNSAAILMAGDAIKKLATGASSAIAKLPANVSSAVVDAPFMASASKGTTTTQQRALPPVRSATYAKALANLLANSLTSGFGENKAV